MNTENPSAVANDDEDKTSVDLSAQPASDAPAESATTEDAPESISSPGEDLDTP